MTEEAEQTFADEVRAFLLEFGQTQMSLDSAVYRNFCYRLLKGERAPTPATIAKARAWMEAVREEEPKRLEQAANIIRAAEGYITMTPGGAIDRAPTGIPHSRLRRMIEAGWLVPTGDTLLADCHSQSYKLSSISP